MFKFYEGLSPPLMDSVFKLKTENPFNLRKVFEFLDQLSTPYIK